MNWSAYFFEIASIVAKKSKDPSMKVGCVIVGQNHEILSTGFNGFPMGVSDSESLYDRYERPKKYLFTEHAERNSIFLAARNGIRLDGSSIYLQWMPCADCARAIIQSGIVKVVIDGSKYDPDHPTEADLRWEDQFKAANRMFEEANVRVVIVKHNSECEENESRLPIYQSER